MNSKNHPFFDNMPEAFVRKIESFSRTGTLESNSHVFHEAEDAKQVFLVLSGAIDLELHAPGKDAMIIETIGPGAILGASWLDASSKWQFDARVKERADLFIIDSAPLKKAMSENHELGYLVLQKMSSTLLGRLQATRLRLLNLYGSR